MSQPVAVTTYDAANPFTSTASEQDWGSFDASGYFELWLSVHNMIAGDTIVVRAHVKDPDGTERKLAEVTLTDAQTRKARLVFSGGADGTEVTNPYPSQWLPAPAGIRVTIQRTAGTDRTYTGWLLKAS